MRSFYLLELWVDPGGARKADYYLFNNLAEIKQTLEKDMSDPIEGAYLVLWYGETINLVVYSEGQVAWEKDLHPYITFHIPGYPPLQGTADGPIRGLDQSFATEREQDGQIGDMKEELSEFLWSESEQLSGYHVEIDWTAMNIPTLTGQLLEPGESAVCKQSYTNHEEPLEYGYNSLE